MRSRPPEPPAPASPGQMDMVTPITSWPASFNRSAATEESTPPLMPTATRRITRPPLGAADRLTPCRGAPHRYIPGTALAGRPRSHATVALPRPRLYALPVPRW